MTPDPAAWLADLPAWSFAFMLVLARFGAAMALLPGLGEASAPSMIRAGLALAITALLLPVIFPTPPPAPQADLAAAGMIGAEVITGLWLGWLARLLCIALSITGQFIAYLLGISTVLQPDPELGAQSTALASLFDAVAPLVILISGLYTLPLTALVGSYRLIPPGTLLPAADSTATAVDGRRAMLRARHAAGIAVRAGLHRLARRHRPDHPHGAAAAGVFRQPARPDRRRPAAAGQRVRGHHDDLAGRRA